MIAIDAHLLLYAYNAEAREHERARARLETTFSSVPLVGLPLVSVLAFVRISTDQRLPDAALTAEQAAEIVGTWLQRDNVSILEPGARHWPIFFDTLIDAGASARARRTSTSPPSRSSMVRPCAPTIATFAPSRSSRSIFPSGRGNESRHLKLGLDSARLTHPGEPPTLNWRRRADLKR